MPNKRASYELADFKADTRPDHLGEATALVSVFGNVDLMGDRVVKGAFEKSLASWQESGDPIPVYWSHDWGNPKSNIGEVTAATETDLGLQVDMKFDIHDNENAAYVFKLLRTRRVKEFSFAYQIEGERKGKDGANELTDLRILEVGPTFKGANPETELLATKAGAELSSANRGRLRTAHDTILGALGDLRAMAGMDEPKNDETAVSEAELAEMQRLYELASAIDAAPIKSEDDEPETVKSEVPENTDSDEPTPAKLDPGLLAMQLRIAEMLDT